MYTLGQFFNINKPFEEANFGVIVEIDGNNYIKYRYHVFLYDEARNLLGSFWTTEAEIVKLENKFAVGDKVKMVDSMDGIYLNDDATEAEYGIIDKVDEEDAEDMPYDVTFYKHNGEWISYWCSGRQLQKVEE